jgi:DNA-binding NtrC family response regulator
MDVLMQYDYPGNVRELENILERAMILAYHEALYVEDLPLHLRQAPSEDAAGADTRPATLPEVVRAIERQMLRRALERHGGVQTRAAAERGISERGFRYKLQKYHLQGDEAEAQNGRGTAPPSAP